jgi:homoserine dehydrogenase
MKTINLVIFGIGNVGSTLINQIESFKNKLKSEQQIDIKIPVIANSTLAFYKDELETEWQVNF